MLTHLIFDFLENKQADLVFFTSLVDKPHQVQLSALPTRINNYLNSIAKINNLQEEQMRQIYQMAVENVENRLFEAEENNNCSIQR